VLLLLLNQLHYFENHKLLTSMHITLSGINLVIHVVSLLGFSLLHFQFTSQFIIFIIITVIFSQSVAVLLQA